MTTTTIEWDHEGQQQVDKLKIMFNASSNAAVVRKALILATMINDLVGDADHVEVVGLDGSNTKIHFHK